MKLRAGIVTAFVFLALGALPTRADTFMVINTADAGPGSFRQAINDANAHPNLSDNQPDRIHFAIPGTGVQTIAPFSALPDITDPLFIDGFTQTGAKANSRPVGQGLNAALSIELNGDDVPFSKLSRGLTITCGRTTVRGLIINRFQTGIMCKGGSANTISGNYIGTDPTGSFGPLITIYAENGPSERPFYGVTLEDCKSSRIGGRRPGERNLISGAAGADVLITGAGATENVVEGNLISTTATGMSPLKSYNVGGSERGVALEDGASANLIGGTVIEARNVISGSGRGNYNAVSITFPQHTTISYAAPFANLVKGNFLGLNVQGTGVMDSDNDPTGFGVFVAGYNNVIGGTEPGARNVISGNHTGGVILGYDPAENNLVQGNFIGTDAFGALPLGNGRFGVELRGRANNNTIGGIEPGAGNRIAFTSKIGSSDVGLGAGVGVFRGYPSSGVGNAIVGNSIYQNAGLGIDHNIDEVTPNDTSDGDIGPNNLQNYPVLTSAGFTAGGVEVRGNFDSTPNQNYRIEIFGDTGTDSSAFGEGTLFLGATIIQTGPDGKAAFGLECKYLVGSRYVTATATDPFGNTSEFSRSLSIAGTPPAQLLNISTRLSVQTGDNVLVGGFIITGINSKKVIVRGIGPSLNQFLDGFLANPTLELFRGNTLLAKNDNWRDTQWTEIEATALQPSHDLESAIVQTLPPGAYTVIVRGSGNTTGIGMVDVYDLDQIAISSLANISIRGFVDSGDKVMIGGIIVGPGGGAQMKVVVRAIGPTLGRFGISGALQNPVLDLVNSNGVVLNSNNNWKEGQPTQLEALALQPDDDRESALAQTVAPGNYTAIVRGDGGTTGVALVEVYQIH